MTTDITINIEIEAPLQDDDVCVCVCVCDGAETYLNPFDAGLLRGMSISGRFSHSKTSTLAIECEV